MIQPHGGKLVDRALKGKKKDDALARSGRLPRLVIDSELVSDVENIATGVYSPLEGFLGEADFRSVLETSRLCSDIPWTVPIVLDVDRKTADTLKIGEEVLLTAEDGRPVGILRHEEKYGFDKGQTAQKGTTATQCSFCTTTRTPNSDSRSATLTSSGVWLDSK